MSSERHVLVTGPVTRIDPWVEAATEAGWRATAYPLVQIEAAGGDLVEHIDGLPDWVAITSSNALPILERTARIVPELLTVRTVVVGDITADKARAIGFKIALTPAPRATELANTLLEHAAAEERVLWPRGSASDELAERLRAERMRVADPIVYETVPIVREAAPPHADAIFFASPSAVDSWRALSANEQPAVAIAIGSTTLSALKDDSAAAFSTTLSLPDPRPTDLSAMLRALAKDD